MILKLDYKLTCFHSALPYSSTLYRMMPSLTSHAPNHGAAVHGAMVRRTWLLSMALERIASAAARPDPDPLSLTRSLDREEQRKHTWRRQLSLILYPLKSLH